MPEITTLKYDERGFPIFPGWPEPEFPDGVVIYYGEKRCMSKLKIRDAPCQKQAYFIEAGRLLCGVHARHCGSALLPRNPNKAQLILDKYSNERAAIEAAAEANLKAGRTGHIIATKLPTMKPTENYPGYMKVFPNSRHGGRKDGFGCPSLSPIRLGPVYHDQPGVPIARSVENCCQANKVYPCEVDARGDPTEEWFDTLLKMYNDVRPHHFKAHALRPTKGQAVEPLYSVWVQPNGKKKKFSNVAARQFFCGLYEQLATRPGTEAAEDLESLRACLAAGYNLQIVGYHARPVLDYGDAPLFEWELLENMYLDPAQPFGHELVLYTMLSLDDPAEYPWRRYKSESF
jgi:hypothetical protein